MWISLERVVDACKHTNENPDSMIGAEFLVRLSECQLIKDYTPQCYVASITGKQMGHAVFYRHIGYRRYSYCIVTVTSEQVLNSCANMHCTTVIL